MLSKMPEKVCILTCTYSSTGNIVLGTVTPEYTVNFILQTIPTAEADDDVCLK